MGENLKQNLVLAGTQWIPGREAACSVPHLSLGQDSGHLLCSPQGRIRGCNHLLFREKSISNSFFNVPSKTKAFESSSSCPWRLLHEAEELKSALKRL